MLLHHECCKTDLPTTSIAAPIDFYRQWDPLVTDLVLKGSNSLFRQHKGGEEVGSCPPQR